MNKNKIFNIYYLNFSKVYEIAMILNNKIIKTITSEVLNGKENGKQRNSKLSVNYMNNIKSEIGEINSAKTYSSDKIIETLEVKTTKSILLRDILDNCKIFNSNDGLAVGDLIYISDINLELENETEIRSFKILRNDAISGLKYEGVDISNLVNSMLNDYAYTLTGKNDNLKNDILFKIPMLNGNEFESLYSINDLLIGKVDIVGIYRGKVKKSALKDNVSVFNVDENYKDTKKTKVKISVSDGNEEENTINDKILNFDQEYEFIDIIAIVQKVNPKIFVEETKDDKKNNNLFKKIINKLFRRNK